MSQRELLDEAHTPGGEPLTLTFEGGQYAVDIAGLLLMSSEAHHSEEHMAEIGCRDVRARHGARVLVGGLGMGYTLRAVLDRLGPTARVVVVELMDAVVGWNRGPIGHLAGHPLDDERVQVEVCDVVGYLAAGGEPFDTILLDVDNGPEAFTLRTNARIYDRAGLQRVRRLLKPGGLLVVWSAFELPPFVDALRAAGLEPHTVRVRARGSRGARHTLYVGRRPIEVWPGDRRRGGDDREDRRGRRRR